MNGMKMKKVAPIALSAILLGAVSVGAAQTTVGAAQQESEQITAFIQTSGKITNIEERGKYTFYSSDSEDNPFQFSVGEETLVFDKKGNKVELKKGDTVTLYIDANQPMILIYPPQYSPAVVIVGEKDEPNFVKVAAFNKEFISEDNELKLTINDETVIVNAKGEKQPKEEITKQNAIVFYRASTFSIPAQTTPDKVVVFPKLEDQVTPGQPDVSIPEIPVEPKEEVNATVKVDQLVGSDFHMKGTTKMVPLRKVAQGLGYKVETTTKGAIISKGALSYTINRGEKTYGYNKAIGQFDVAPALLQSGKTYVQYDFALELANNN
jgi:hypothetical protein